MAFEIFPNPVNDKFTLRYQKSDIRYATLEITDLTGKVVQTADIRGGSETGFGVDVSHLKSGVYFCKLITKKANATKKLIIQK
jgi:hypothetical protein